MNKHRKLALAVLASITIAGIAGASASSLGGLNTTGIGSDDEVTASCDSNSINVNYVTQFIANSATPGSGSTAVTGVNFSGVDQNCDLKTATLTLVGATNNVLATASGTVAWSAANNGSFSLPLSGNVSAQALEGISLVIQG